MENKTDTQKKVYSKDIIIFSFFLLFSFVLWCLNYLGKDIESELKAPVKFVNSPIEKTIASTPEYLDVSLKGIGYSIFKLKYSGKKDSVSVDFSKVAYGRVRNTVSDYYILTSTLAKPYESQMKAKCEVLSMKPDTLYFKFKESETD